MEAKFDGMLNRLEASFNKWLSEFEAQPLRTGLKVLFIVVVVRWLYKKFAG